ncbi:MAG: hypothetical protein ABIS08_11335 [Pseudolysinimonas sp.]
MRKRITAVMSAGVAGAVALLLLAGYPTPTHTRGDSHPLRLPIGLPASVVLQCERSVGLGDSSVAPTYWRDSQGVHMRIGHSRRHGIGVGSGGGLSNTESALLSCLTVATGPLQQYPSDSASLLLLWKYSTTVLWPCITEHDIALGAPPSRADVLSGDPLLIDPYAQLHSQLSAVRLAQLRLDCPALPAYLTPAS